MQPRIFPQDVRRPPAWAFPFPAGRSFLYSGATDTCSRAPLGDHAGALSDELMDMLDDATAWPWRFQAVVVWSWRLAGGRADPLEGHDARRGALSLDGVLEFGPAGADRKPSRRPRSRSRMSRGRFGAWWHRLEERCRAPILPVAFPATEGQHGHPWSIYRNPVAQAPPTARLRARRGSSPEGRRRSRPERRSRSRRSRTRARDARDPAREDRHASQRQSEGATCVGAARRDRPRPSPRFWAWRLPVSYLINTNIISEVRNEPPRVCRRLISLSHAAMAAFSPWAW